MWHSMGAPPPKKSQEAQNVGREHQKNNLIKLLFYDLALGFVWAIG